jgi:hypothetical protein
MVLVVTQDGRKYWELIDDSESASWQNIDNSESTTWQNVDDSESTTWAVISTV